jgi:hypothetical protein
VLARIVQLALFADAPGPEGMANAVRRCVRHLAHVVQIAGYEFRFFSLDRGEPPHVHAWRSGKLAKIWLSPVEVEWNWGYNVRELNKMLWLVRKHQKELLDAWDKYFT